jgi:hypothetical protein
VICSSADVVRISVLVRSDPIRGSATPLTTTSSSLVESAAASDELHSASIKALQAITFASALEETARLVIKGLTAEILDSLCLHQACTVSPARSTTVYYRLAFMDESYDRASFLQCPA